MRKLIFQLNDVLAHGSTLKVLDELKKNESLTRDKILEIQWEKLEKIIAHAYKHVPFYRKFWDKHGVKPSDIHHFDDFEQKIPFITKDDVRNYFEEFKADNPFPGLFTIYTSGTTGAPTKFLRDSLSRSYGLACRFRGRSWWGVGPTDTEVRLWGKYTAYSPSFRETLHDFLKRVKDRVAGIYYLSTLDTTDKDLERYYNIIKKVKPSVLLGYSSAWYILSKYIKEHGWNLLDSGIKVVSYTAEVFMEPQKEVVYDVFGDILASEYGAKENGIISFECPHKSLHIMEEDVYLESCKIGEEKNQLIATNLNSFSFPLIRYITEDVGEITDGICKCGLPLRVMKLSHGRTHDYIYTPDGRILVPTNFEHALLFPLRHQKGCRRYQLIQHKLDKIEVIVEVRERLSDEMRRKITDGVRTLVGDKMNISITETQKIRLEPSGKFKFIISYLPKDKNSVKK